MTEKVCFARTAIREENELGKEAGINIMRVKCGRWETSVITLRSLDPLHYIAFCVGTFPTHLLQQYVFSFHFLSKSCRKRVEREFAICVRILSPFYRYRKLKLIKQFSETTDRGYGIFRKQYYKITLEIKHSQVSAHNTKAKIKYMYINQENIAEQNFEFVDFNFIELQ